MAHLIKIGNSQGIRIPKPLIKQAHLEGKELKLQALNGRIFITPIQKAREVWKQSIEETLATQGAGIIDNEWLDAELIPDDELEW